MRRYNIILEYMQLYLLFTKHINNIINTIRKTRASLAGTSTYQCYHWYSYFFLFSNPNIYVSSTLFAHFYSYIHVIGIHPNCSYVLLYCFLFLLGGRFGDMDAFLIAISCVVALVCMLLTMSLILLYLSL